MALACRTPSWWRTPARCRDPTRASAAHCPTPALPAAPSPVRHLHPLSNHPPGLGGQGGHGAMSGHRLLSWTLTPAAWPWAQRTSCRCPSLPSSPLTHPSSRQPRFQGSPLGSSLGIMVPRPTHPCLLGFPQVCGGNQRQPGVWTGCGGQRWGALARGDRPPLPLLPSEKVSRPQQSGPLWLVTTRAGGEEACCRP